MFPIDNVPPLHGVRVLDAARVLAGPFCGQLLADLGAEVIKLERPGTGDDTRGWGPPFVGPLSAYFISCNRNKRSITLDIQKPAGEAIFHQLLDQCDVLIENFRTDSAKHLGLTPEKLLARHPRLIACSISGFGRTGPWKDVPGYDFAIQALSGMMNITGPLEGPPYKVGVALADILTGQYASTAILACLHARARSGHGYAIDVSLLDCALAAQVNVAQAYLSTGKVSPRQGNAHLQIVPYRLYATADGWLVLNVGNDSQWQSFCKATGEAELANDPRFTTNRLRVTNRAEIEPIVEAIMKKQTTDAWEKILNDANVTHAAVWDYARLFASEHIAARGMKVTVHDPQGQPVDLIGNPIHLHGALLTEASLAPTLGQHTHEVLKTLANVTDEQLAELKNDKTI